MDEDVSRELRKFVGRNWRRDAAEAVADGRLVGQLEDSFDLLSPVRWLDPNWTSHGYAGRVGIGGGWEDGEGGSREARRKGPAALVGHLNLSRLYLDRRSALDVR